MRTRIIECGGIKLTGILFHNEYLIRDITDKEGVTYQCDCMYPNEDTKYDNKLPWRVRVDKRDNIIIFSDSVGQYSLGCIRDSGVEDMLSDMITHEIRIQTYNNTNVSEPMIL